MACIPPVIYVVIHVFEHYLKLADKGGGALFIEMNDRLRIASSGEMVRGFEPLLELHVVVDFAIETDPDRPVLIGAGLLPRAEVNDTEPSMPKRGAAAEINSGFIRAAMALDIGHRPD